MVQKVCEYCLLVFDFGFVMVGSIVWDKLGVELLLLFSSVIVLLFFCGEIIFFLKKSLSYLYFIDSFLVRDSQILYIYYNERFLFDLIVQLEIGVLRSNEESLSFNCFFVERIIDYFCFLGWKEVIFYIVKFNFSLMGFENI